MTSSTESRNLYFSMVQVLKARGYSAPPHMSIKRTTVGTRVIIGIDDMYAIRVTKRVVSLLVDGKRRRDIYRRTSANNRESYAEIMETIIEYIKSGYKEEIFEKLKDVVWKAFYQRGEKG